MTDCIKKWLVQCIATGQLQTHDAVTGLDTGSGLDVWLTCANPSVRTTCIDQDGIYGEHS